MALKTSTFNLRLHHRLKAVIGWSTQMNFSQEPIFQWLSQYAYEPHMVFAAVFVMMMASGFGLPIPEEVTIISVGILSYMGAHPELFPPPTPGAAVVSGYPAAFFTFGCIFMADLVVFFIGRKFGRKLMVHPKFAHLFSSGVMTKINSWTGKYGPYAAFIFRITPRICFPAHLALGMSPLPSWKFAAVDGLAGLISVPTQVLLIYYYGEEILKVIHKFKIGLGICLITGLLCYFAYKLYKKFRGAAV